MTVYALAAIVPNLPIVVDFPVLPDVRDCPAAEVSCNDACTLEGDTLTCAFDTPDFGLDITVNPSGVQVGHQTNWDACCHVPDPSLVNHIVVTGSSGVDYVATYLDQGSDVFVEVYGGAGEDRMTMFNCDTTSNVRFYGEADDDVMTSWDCQGGPRAELQGGDGDDTILVYPGSRGQGLNGVDTMTCLASATSTEGCLMYGNDGADIMNGGPYDDELYGGDGNDLIYGNDGADFIDGQHQDDTLYGGPGDDELMGGAGDDTVSGDEGYDYVMGGVGSDTLYGGEGSDTLIGACPTCTTDGADVLYGGEDEDWLYGDCTNNQCTARADTLYGGPGPDHLYGERGKDVLWGEDGDDWLDGGPEDDELHGQAGADQLLGGDGNDTLCEDFGQGDGLFGGNGTDILWYGPGVPFVPGFSDATGGTCGHTYWGVWAGTCDYSLVSTPAACVEW